MLLRRLAYGLALVLCATAPLFYGTSAQAQATRTWVSGVGDDANPCSRTAPCKTFAGAISKTAPSGEINVLDPGGFGAVTITKAITISSVGFEAGVLVSGTNGIVVAAGATDQVVLEGLDIEGIGTGLDGIKVLTGGTVYVLRSKIHHFTGNGINMVNGTSGGRLIVKDTVIFQNGTSGSNPLTGGINVNGTANASSIIDTVIDGNQNFAVQVTNGNIVSLTRAFLSNPGSLTIGAGGTAICFGPSNVIAGAVTCSSSVNFK